MALITLTSSFGAGGENIAQRVSDHLGIEFFDDRKLQQRALSMGISIKDVESLDEKAPGFFDRLFTNKPALYLDILGAVVYDVAAKGEGVIVGHGAQLFLQDFTCALHVMIHASEAARSRRITKKQNMNETDAIGLMRKMDKRLKEFVQYAFDRDWNDPSGYDMVINLDKIGEDWAAKLIIDLATSHEIKECSLKALDRMESSSLRRRIDAAIIKNNLSFPSEPILIEVIGNGQVHLSGKIHSDSEHKRLIEIVRSVPGVSEVRSDVLVFPSWVFS